MILHKEIIWARGTSFNVSPRPELPLTSSVFYFVNYPRTQDILCFLFCLQYLPFITANGTSFNVSPRPELPLTSSVFYFVNYPRTQDILCFLCCLCSFYFGKWNLFQCLSKTWVTTDKQYFLFCEMFSAFCFAYVAFILANGTSFNVFPRPELPLTSTVFHFLNYPVANSINQEVFKVAVGWELVCNPSSTWNSAQMLIEEWGMHWFQRASFKKSFYFSWRKIFSTLKQTIFHSNDTCHLLPFTFLQWIQITSSEGCKVKMFLA